MSHIIHADHAPPADENRGNIFSFVQRNPSGKSPSSPAFIRASDGKVLTRQQLFTDAKRLAFALRHTLNLKPGQRFGLISPNSILYPVVAHAGLCAGLEVVPLNPGYGPEELLHPIADAEIEYFITHPSALDAVRKGIELSGIGFQTKDGKPRVWICDDADEGGVKGPNGEKDIRSLMGKEQLEPHNVSDPVATTAFIAYSSGTSGKPKGVMLTHSNMTSVTASLEIAMAKDVTPDDVQLAVLPFQHIFALAKFMHHGLYIGSTTIVLPRFDLEAWCSAVQKYKVTIGIVVPPILVLLAKSPITKKYDLSSLKYFLCGAAPLSKELGEEIESVIPGVKCCQGYGLTETSPTATYGSYLEYHAHLGSAGKLVPGVSMRLVDEEGKDVGGLQGQDGGPPGEVWLKGKTIMKGYLNNEKATKECITEDGWFMTGDVGVVKRGYLYIVDRKKELIKYKGYQVAPAELEALLLTHPKIADAACLGIYDKAQATELPRAYIVVRPELNLSQSQKEEVAKEIVQWTNERVANHKKLRGGVRVLDAIPKSPSGKILRRILRDQQAAEEAASEAPKAKL